MSPCELLNFRDKFRQAPPPDLAHIKYNEVEGYFGVLITLYHIRKLLSSHGIRPSYEMLEEKLQQGYGTVLISQHKISEIMPAYYMHIMYLSIYSTILYNEFLLNIFISKKHGFNRVIQVLELSV